MTLPELSIRRPVLATVLNLVILLVGVICYQRLTVRQVPKIETPVVTVNTGYPGANSSVMESQITKPIEDALAGIEGVDYINSVSRPESSQVTVVFQLDRDPNAAASDVRDRVGQARELLPVDVHEPIVQKQEADAQPIIWLSFSSDRHDQLAVADYAQRYVKDRLQAIPGVAQARLFAALYSMRIWLDSPALAAFGLTPADVENALRAQNVEIPAGRIESTNREFTVLAQTDLTTPEQFRAITLKNDGHQIVRLGDVARVELGPSDDRSLGRFNGKPSVPLGLVKQSTANPLDISKALKVEVQRIAKQLPAGMKVDVAYDSTIFIDASIKSVYATVAEAVLLVVLVIFLFLRTWRATLIPLVTIPVSLLGAFALMYALGFSINTLTLLSMVLAIGLVVDDAIVVLENIHRHIEEGMTPFAAALQGGREIGFAVIAMTLTLAAVYVPIAFQTGATGKLFIEFALTLAGAVIVSGFVALTLSPMMCSKLLRHEAQPGRFYLWGERVLDGLTDFYRRTLGVIIRWRALVVGLLAAMLISVGLLWNALPDELSPKEDPGFVMVFGQGPEGSTLEFMDKYARQIEDVYKGVPEIDRYFLFVGWPNINNTISFPGLKDWGDRSRSAQEIQGQLYGQFSSIPGIMAFPQVPNSLGGGLFGQDMEFIVQTTESYDDLNKMVDALKQQMTESGKFVNPRSDLEMNKPELHVNVNRDKVAAIGADVASVGRTLETMMGGRQVTRFKRGSEQYDVLVQLDKDARRTPDALTGVYVRAKDGSMVPLSNLVSVSEGVAARELNHFNKLRAASISAALAPGMSLGEGIAWMETTLKKIAGDRASYDLGGQSREFRKIQSSTLMLFGLALAFIFLVLAAQFESFRDPFVILLSVPLAIGGALFTLWILHLGAGWNWWRIDGSLNIYSKIGLVTLIGLIAKHGILIVEFANQRARDGAELAVAAVEAAALRLRPILMTTGAMVLGAMPLAFAHGAGSEARAQIGWAVVGGMSFGTVFTLFVVPVMYTLLASRRHAHQQEDPAGELAHA